MGGIGILLAGRTTYLAVAENEKYITQSESNRVNLSLIPPRRGLILDRNGFPLASNRADFRVDIIPERVTDPDKIIDELGELLSLESDRITDIKSEVKNSSGFRPIEIASGLDYETYATLGFRIGELPGVRAQSGSSRFYATGVSVGHIVGYVGPASSEEYEMDRNPLLITPGYKIGKDGAEKQFEQTLRGVPGASRVEVTANGQIVRNLESREEIRGDSVKLTIDGPLQDYASRRLGMESGSAVVIDCTTGELLCMASMPSYDPNSFSDGIGSIEYAMLREDERVPLRNKVLKGLYPPGSTIKPIVSLALLEQGVSHNETVYCGGGIRVGNRTFRCWKRGGHGTVDMKKAIAESCDVYFYRLAQRVGMDPIARMARTCGLGETYEIPVSSQFYGTVPDPNWKLAKYGEPWQAFDTVNSTIGQGYMLANPLQLAVSAARIASGKLIQPQLVVDQLSSQQSNAGFSSSDVSLVRDAMNEVVNGNGTAAGAKIPLPGIQMAGKTGTAQVVSLDYSDGKSGPWKYRDHGLFTFFAPFENPRYAGAVVVEHGGGSASAYPIARDIVTYLFDPQLGLEKLRALENVWGGTAQERWVQDYRNYAKARGTDIPFKKEVDKEMQALLEAEARLQSGEPSEALTKAIAPRPEINLIGGGTETYQTESALE